MYSELSDKIMTIQRMTFSMVVLRRSGGGGNVNEGCVGGPLLRAKSGRSARGPRAVYADRPSATARLLAFSSPHLPRLCLRMSQTRLKYFRPQETNFIS